MGLDAADGVAAPPRPILPALHRREELIAKGEGDRRAIMASLRPCESCFWRSLDSTTVADAFEGCRHTSQSRESC